MYPNQAAIFERLEVTKKYGLLSDYLVSWSGRYTTPYVQEWNFSIQKQLPWQMVWETSYVGNKGTSLWGQYEGNQPLTNGPGSPTTRRPLAKYTVASIKSFTPWNRTTFEGMSSHLDKRLTRLSGLARSGALVAMLGSWLLLLPTMPLMNAARVVKCWARRPLGSPGYHCFKA